jgi:hypothetical protein
MRHRDAGDQYHRAVRESSAEEFLTPVDYRDRWLWRQYVL